MAEFYNAGVKTPDEKPVDKRVEASRGKVLRETYRILTEHGFAGASIDAIAKGSGVAKTTIYRHWPSRVDLLMDACARLGQPEAAPDTGSLREDLSVLLLRLAGELKTAGWPSVLPSIIDAAERDDEVAEMFSRLHAGTTAAYRTVFSRAQKRGDFGHEIKISDLMAMSLGALFYQRWYAREALTERSVRRIVDLLLAGLGVEKR